MTAITLREVADAVERAHGFCSYYHRTNETLGPYQVDNLDGPTTSRHYDCTRQWDTQIAVALAEEAFGVDLSRYDIVSEGPWRDTVRSIARTLNAEMAEEESYEKEINV
jgi:hypothetical protein